MNNKIEALKQRMNAIVDEFLMLAQDLELLQNESQKVQEENSKLKNEIKLGLIDTASQQPRESPKRCKGVCIE